MREDGACVERALLWTRSWLLSSLCHYIGCFLFLPWRDTDPRSASEKNKLIYGGTQIEYHFPFRVPPPPSIGK